MVDDISEIILAIEESKAFKEKLEERTTRLMETEKKKGLKELFSSDLWDGLSVADDISDEEFLENEIFFETL